MIGWESTTAEFWWALIIFVVVTLALVFYLSGDIKNFMGRGGDGEDE